MVSVKEEVAKNLLFYRKKSNLTQKELANKIGVKHNSISSWENATNSIDVEVLFKICSVLNISLNEIYGDYANIQKEEEIPEIKNLINSYKILNQEGREKVAEYINDIINTGKYTQDGEPMVKIYKAAKSIDNQSHEVVWEKKSVIDKLNNLPKVTNEEDL